MAKYYVVWRGRKPGVYSNWASAFEQVHKFSGARFKSYRDRDEAYKAYRQPAPTYGQSPGVHSTEQPTPSSIAAKASRRRSNRSIKEIPKYQSSLIEAMQIALARFQEKVRQPATLRDARQLRAEQTPATRREGYVK